MTNESAPRDQGDLHLSVDPAPSKHRGRIVLLIFLALMPVLLTAVALPFLPDIVSLHYGASGVPDRWGPKAEHFVTGIMCSVTGLAFAGIYAVSEHQRRVGREDWLVLNVSPKRVFPIMLAATAFLAVMQAVILAASFWQSGPVVPNDLVRLSVDVVFGAIVLPFFALGLYMVVTGKGTQFISGHPGTSDLERRIGADKSQARAIGCFLLFAMGFIIFTWAMSR